MVRIFSEEVEWGLAQSIRETKDGGFIIIGITESADKLGYVPWLAKTDEQGNKQWFRTLDRTTYHTGYFEETLTSVLQTEDGGYLVVCTAESDDKNRDDLDALLFKLDQDGETSWFRTLGTPGELNAVLAAIPTSDGGYILAGREDEPWLIKVDAEGQEVWSRHYSNRDFICFSTVQEAADGGYLVTGQSGDEAWLLKTDEYGRIY